MQLNIHIGVPILATTLMFLFVSMGVYHYGPQEQHTPTHYNATHEDTLYEAHKIAIDDLQNELTSISEDPKQFKTITDTPLFSPDKFQRYQTVARHIEQLQKATACEGTGPWKAEAYLLAVMQERQMSICEWLGGSRALNNAIMTYEEVRVCLVETGDAVMAADGKITHVQEPNHLYVRDIKWPIGDEQALWDMRLHYCQEVLELREEFARDSGELAEGKFLRRSMIRRWKMR